MSAKLRLIICSELEEQEEVCPAEEEAEPPKEVVRQVRREADKQQTLVNKLFPALLGLCLATLFGLMAYAVYGTMDLRNELWVAVVICVMSMTGVLISLLQFSPPAWLVGRFRKAT